MKRKLPPCWCCQKHLWGSKHMKLRHEGDGHVRVFHIGCAKEMIKAHPGHWKEV